LLFAVVVETAPSGRNHAPRQPHAPPGETGAVGALIVVALLTWALMAWWYTSGHDEREKQDS